MLLIGWTPEVVDGGITYPPQNGFRQDTHGFLWFRQGSPVANGLTVRPVVRGMRVRVVTMISQGQASAYEYLPTHVGTCMMLEADPNAGGDTGYGGNYGNNFGG